MSASGSSKVSSSGSSSMLDSSYVSSGSMGSGSGSGSGSNGTNNDFSSSGSSGSSTFSSGSSSSKSCGELPDGGQLFYITGSGKNGEIFVSETVALPEYDRDCFDLILSYGYWTGVVADTFTLDYTEEWPINEFFNLTTDTVQIGDGPPPSEIPEYKEVYIPGEATHVHPSITYGDHDAAGFTSSTAWWKCDYFFTYIA